MYFILGNLKKMSKKSLKVEICMGSSCFSRGNKYSLPIIQSFIKDNNLDADLDLSGCLCSGNCSNGPIIIINGNMYDKVHPDSLKDLLLHVIKGDVNE